MENLLSSTKLLPQSSISSAAVQQKHKLLFDRLRLKSLTVDSRKTFILSKPHHKRLVVKPKLDLKQLFIKGKGQEQSSTHREFRVGTNYQQFTTFWKSVYTQR